MDLVSVIVAVYNTAPYLPQCMESLLSQTHTPLEVILVDDGSTDGSGAVCDGYAVDERVSVYHKANGGLADARNFGLCKARGAWVLFMDSDDYYLRPTAVAELWSAARVHRSDLVCFQYCRLAEKGGGRRLGPPLITPPADPESLEEIIRGNAYTSSACLKLISRALIEDNGIRFCKGHLSEDVEFCMSLLLRAESCAFCGEAVYVYRARRGSITRSVSPKHVDDLTEIIGRCERMAKECAEGPKKRAAAAYLGYQYATLLINIHLAKAPKSRRQTVYDMKGLLDADTIPAVRLARRFCKILGVRTTSWLLFLYYKASRR